MVLFTNFNFSRSPLFPCELRSSSKGKLVFAFHFRHVGRSCVYRENNGSGQSAAQKRIHHTQCSAITAPPILRLIKDGNLQLINKTSKSTVGGSTILINSDSFWKQLSFHLANVPSSHHSTTSSNIALPIAEGKSEHLFFHPRSQCTSPSASHPNRHPPQPQTNPPPRLPTSALCHWRHE